MSTAFVPTGLAAALVALLSACAPSPPPAEPHDVIVPREVRARWSIVNRPAPPNALSWHNPLEVALVVDGRVIDVGQEAECVLGGDEWQGRVHPLSMLHCKFMGPGDANVGVFRVDDALVVRVQTWEPTDADQGPPKIDEAEVGRVVVPASSRVVFDAPSSSGDESAQPRGPRGAR